MKSLVRGKLREIVANHGPPLFRDAQRCENLLAEACGKSRQEVFLLVTALKAGVVARLLAPTADTPVEDAINALARKLHRDYAIVEEAARWAVESWAVALHLPDGEPDREADESPVELTDQHSSTEGEAEAPVEHPEQTDDEAGEEQTSRSVTCPVCSVPLLMESPAVKEELCRCPCCHWTFRIDVEGAKECLPVSAPCPFSDCKGVITADRGEGECPECGQAFTFDGRGKVLGGFTQCVKCKKLNYYPEGGGVVACRDCAWLMVVDEYGKVKDSLKDDCPSCESYLQYDGIGCFRCCRCGLRLDRESAAEVLGTMIWLRCYWCKLEFMSLRSEINCPKCHALVNDESDEEEDEK